MADVPESADVVIVGAGPAGLSAAAELRARGAGRVIVLDREPSAGGVPRFCGHSPYGWREFRRPMFGPAYARALEDRARGAGAEILIGATVTALLPGPRLSVSTANGTGEIAARAVLLATGARESSRAARLIGGTKPGGVLSTGALQGLVYGRGLRPFRRPVIVGTELVSFSALLTCRHAGARPVAMIETSPRITAREPASLLPRLLGVPLLRGARVTAIRGGERVEAVEVLAPDGPTTFGADGVVVTGDFRPEAALVRSGLLRYDPATGGPDVDEGGRCSEAGYYAAGNLLRPVETAGWCWAEGRAVARVMADDLRDRVEGGKGVRIEVSGDALKYVMPQRLSGAGQSAFDTLQIRVGRPAKGVLRLSAGGREVASHAIDALPERRLVLPLPAPRGPVAIAFDEESA